MCRVTADTADNLFDTPLPAAELCAAAGAPQLVYTPSRKTCGMQNAVARHGSARQRCLAKAQRRRAAGPAAVSCQRMLQRGVPSQPTPQQLPSPCAITQSRSMRCRAAGAGSNGAGSSTPAGSLVDVPVKELHELCASVLRAAGSSGGSDSVAAVDAASLAQLRALGAGTGPASTSATSSSHSSNSSSDRSGWRLSTRLLHPAQSSVHDPYNATGAPIYQTATFGQPDAISGGPYDYTRSGNPSRTQLEEQVAELEGAVKAFAFTSGMAALSAATKLVPTGGHIVAGDDLYGGTSRLLSQVVPNFGISVSNVDMSDVGNVIAAIQAGMTKLVMVESPTNPRMQICDIRAIVEASHAAGALVCVDNSFMSPLWQRPLELGADLSMMSGTKYFGGHSDVTLGTLAVQDEELAKRIYFLQNAEGAGLAPFDSWLAARGLKTMALRMEKQAHNAAAMASFLTAHPLVTRVNYAGLPGHPGAELHASQCSSGGGVLSFDTGDLEVSKTIVNETKLFKITVSFGNVASQISLPCFMSHASIPAAVRAARGLPDSLVRISAGVEDVKDLIADLDQALALAGRGQRERLGSRAAAVQQ